MFKQLIILCAIYGLGLCQWQSSNWDDVIDDFQSYQGKARRYLARMPIINEELQSKYGWAMIQENIKDITNQFLSAQDAKRFTFITLEQFKAHLVSMGRWLVQQGINGESSAVILNINEESDSSKKGKSSEWVLANLMQFAQVKPQWFYKGDGDIPETITKIFIIDDASYSGNQIQDPLLTLRDCRDCRFIKSVIIGVPYMSVEAKEQIKAFSGLYSLRFGITMYPNSQTIPTLLNPISDNNNYRDGKHLTAFQHKIPDGMSIPTQLSDALRSLFMRNVKAAFPPYKELLSVSNNNNNKNNEDGQQFNMNNYAAGWPRMTFS
jgi:hypothetical protein